MHRHCLGSLCALLIGVAAANVAAAQEADLESSDRPEPPAASFVDQSALRIEQVLDLPLREPLDAVERPLNDIMHEWADVYEIPILIDMPALDAVAISQDAPVTISLSEITLRSALNLLLRRVSNSELTYVVADEVLLITTREEEVRHSTVRVYRVDDLAGDAPQARAGSGADFDSVVAMITSCIERDSWMENGAGEGGIHLCEPGLIVVTQTAAVHRQIEALLGSLRREQAAIRAEQAAARERRGDRPVTRAVSLQNEAITSGDNRELLRETLQRSVDWQLDDASEIAEDDVFIQVLPNLVVVRHLPHVVDDVAELVRQISPPHPGLPPTGSMAGPRSAP